MRLAAAPLLALALALSASAASIGPLPPALRAELTGPFWHKGCPVSLSQLRVLTIRHWGFDRRAHTGQLVVNEDVAAPRFPIRDLQLEDAYGPHRLVADEADVSDAFECRQAVASPCTSSASTGTGHWSEHAYGHAVDLNPVENPYVGCGMTRHRASLPYLDRSRLRLGMVTPAVVAAFRSIGWGWGGSWSGATKDYMHFSASGH